MKNNIVEMVLIKSKIIEKSEERSFMAIDGSVKFLSSVNIEKEACSEIFLIPYDLS